MNNQLLEEKSYNQIVANQASILEELDRTNLNIKTVNELSSRFIGDAYEHFQQGIEAISRIRNNLDQIHHDLVFIKKSRKQQSK